MPVEEVVFYHERCDRCRSLLAVYERPVNGRSKDQDRIIERRAKSMGSFYVETSGKRLIGYQKVCPACYSRLMKLVEANGILVVFLLACLKL